MKILILHQRALYRADRSVSGEMLRVLQLQKGLQGYGHDMATLCVQEYTKVQLRHQITSFGPDKIIATHASQVVAVVELNIPIVLDLYAQRIMESIFEDRLTQEVMEVLGVISACSLFLVSNDRQRWSWQGILAMNGAKLKPESILVVPLSATLSEPQTKEQFVLIGGGVWWPWQNPWPSMQRALNHLDKRDEGMIIWIGAGKAPIAHKRLRIESFSSYSSFRMHLSQSSAAFDWMEHNVEREYAIAFRHMDYLGCGLPILTGEYSPLSHMGSGFFSKSDDIEAVLDRCLDEPSWIEEMSSHARAIAKLYSIEKTTKVLSDRISSNESIQWEVSPIHDTAVLWEKLLQVQRKEERLCTQNEILQEDIRKKTQEIESHNNSIALQRDVIAQLSRSVQEVVAYRKETVQILGGQIAQHSNAHQELESENAILRADIAKKSAELAAMDQLVLRLENDVQALREQLLRKRGILRRN